MNLKEAQNVAEKFSLNRLDITLLEIRGALVMLANFYEDNKYLDPDYTDPFIDNDNPNYN